MSKKKIEEVEPGEVIDTVEEDDNEMLKTSFIISDGREDVRIVAMKNCWGIQRFKTVTNKKTKEETSDWVTSRYVVDLGSIAQRVFDMRLKNSEASTLLELSEAGRQIAADIRKEFSVQGCACK